MAGSLTKSASNQVKTPRETGETEPEEDGSQPAKEGGGGGWSKGTITNVLTIKQGWQFLKQAC